MTQLNVAFNEDCLEAMRKMPDNAFDLAVVDPPYGAGFTEGGGCKGWFAKYHQDNSQSVNVEREREREREKEAEALHFRFAEERPKLREPAAHGRTNTQKNHKVGHGSTQRVL